MSSWERNSGCKRSRASSTDDVDRLSNLPESVLSHILSFLPTKDAVVTSLVSKRWIFLWKNIHSLIFSDDDVKCGDSGRDREDRNSKIKFANFVDKVFQSLNRQHIGRFSLNINESCELYDVTTWIDYAVARKVEVLEFLFIEYGRPIPLPCSLFTCKTLEVLKLKGSSALNAATSICLPNLKTLHLTGVKFLCNESFRDLVSGCSALQTLYVKRIVYDNVVFFTVSSPTLTNLTLDFNQRPFSFPEVYAYKLEINAPALTYLDLSDNLSKYFSIEGLCSLEKASINLSFELQPIAYDYDLESKAVGYLLQGLYTVKDLVLQSDAFEALGYAGVYLSFPRLTRLTVKAKCCNWHSLLNLVEASNKLMYLSFSKESDRRSTHVKRWRRPEIVPICLLSCLETMSFHGFTGLGDELKIVAYILENAKVLRTMMIEAAHYLHIETKFQLLQKVANFPRGSAKCKITFF